MRCLQDIDGRALVQTDEPFFRRSGDSDSAAGADLALVVATKGKVRPLALAGYRHDAMKK
jgi:hypothetical protein